jgi:hypothetical protein
MESYQSQANGGDYIYRIYQQPYAQHYTKNQRSIWFDPEIQK